eukprot:SAG31_NODE_17852_length_655_cov_2.239209_1_plen_36_part_10
MIAAPSLTAWLESVDAAEFAQNFVDEGAALEDPNWL